MTSPPVPVHGEDQEECYEESDVVALAERAVDDINTHIAKLGNEYKNGTIDKVEAELRLFGLAWQYQNAYRHLACVLQCEDIAVGLDDFDELMEELWSSNFSAPANQLGYQCLEMNDSFMEELNLSVEESVTNDDGESIWEN